MTGTSGKNKNKTEEKSGTNTKLNGKKPKQPPKRRGRAGRTILLAGGALGAIGYGAWQAGRTRFSSKISGKLALPGLKAEVEVIRDKWGVPHLYASSMQDLMFAQGFVQAQDRFWQMEFQRRLAAGRLSEVVGEATLPYDKTFRRLNLKACAEQDYNAMSGEERGLLLHFCEGVNAFLAQKKLPIEFSILRYKPEEWQPLDCLIWSKVMAIAQSLNFDTELIRAMLVQKVGAETAARLEPLEIEDLPMIVPMGVDYSGVDFDTILAEFERLHEIGGFAGAGAGSNAWAVDGSKSVTGKPLLAHDPHISTTMPGVWYEMHLNAPDFEVAGVSIPGIPLIIIGHNRHIAWGIPNTMSDFQDGFIEKVDPTNPKRYEYRGEWREFESWHEEIKIKSKPSFHKEFFRSVHGPIMSDFNPNIAENEAGTPEKPVAVCWTLYQTSRAFRATFRLNKAHSWQDFREALRDWDIPSLSFTYADTEGNIGYQFTGRIPIRGKGKGMLPSPGHTGEYDWVGYIPFDELPSLFNPETHYVCAANNRLTDNTYPYHLGSEYVGGWRAKRIITLLTAKEKLSMEDFRQIQSDVYSEPGHIFARLMLQIEPENEKERQALSYFRTWDGHLTTTSVAGSLYKMSIYKLLRLLFVPMLGEPLANKYLGVGDDDLAPLNMFSGLPGPMIIRLIEGNYHSFLPEGQTWEKFLRQALAEAMAELSQRLGEDMGNWEWGKLHTMKYNHPLGAVKPLDRIFNRGPQPVGGDTDTVFQTGYAGKNGDFTANGATASVRFLADMDNLDNSLIGITGGQSGSPFSPHYFDQAENWANGELHPMLSKRAELAANSEGTLILTPG